MEIKTLHSFDVEPKEATEIQRDLQDKIEIHPLEVEVERIAGCDLSFNRNSETVYGAVVILDFSSLEVIEKVTVERTMTFPYISGYLAFREVPVLCDAFEKIQKEPDLVLCDGQGIMHPRYMGLASHLGLFLDIPTIGCAKTPFVGDFEEVAEKKGSQSDIIYKGETVGVVYRSRDKVKPIYISPGHKINLEDSIAIVEECLVGYRIPAPTRQAHILANKARKAGDK